MNEKNHIEHKYSVFFESRNNKTARVRAKPYKVQKDKFRFLLTNQLWQINVFQPNWNDF